MPAADHVVGQGDEGGLLEAVLRDSAGDPVDISAADVTLKMAPIAGGALVIDAAASNDQVDSDDTTIGNVSYEWQAVDTAEAGHYVAEFEVAFAGGEIVTFPNVDPIIVQITPKIGGA